MSLIPFQLRSVQSLSCVQLFVTPWTAACHASLSISNSQSLLKLMSIKLVMPSNGLILCRPFLLLPSIFPSIWVCSNELVLLIRWPKYSASTPFLPMNIQDWFPLGLTGWISLLSKRLSKSRFQHHSSKASILWCSAFFLVQLSDLYVTTGKTALTIWTFVGKVMSLLFNMLFRFVTAFLPRSKHLFISWLQSPSTAILEPKKIKSVTVSTFPPSTCHEVMWKYLLKLA